jgi:hypothetical protein
LFELAAIGLLKHIIIMRFELQTVQRCVVPAASQQLAFHDLLHDHDLSALTHVSPVAHMNISAFQEA